MTRNILGVLAVVLAAAAPAGAQERPPAAFERTVTTSGEAIVKVVPDQAWVTVGIEARAPKPQEVQQRAAQVMTAIQTQLKALGIPETAIRTVSFNLAADWDYSNDRRRLRGYVLSNLVEVRVDDLTKVADVIDRSITAGGNRIHGVRWDIQNRERVEREALRRAVEDAKQRAEVAVAAAGAKLGPVARITEQRHDMPRPMDMAMMRQTAALEAAPQTPINPGEMEIRSTVSVSFTIQ